MRVWLFRIAANLWRDRLRKAESQKTADLELSRRVPARVADPGETLAQRERLEEALRILDSLPPRQREVLYLAAVEAMGAPEIAEVLGISAEAVKASLSLARRTVRQRFDALEGV
jgi:RNA polymerase sigma-70 factor (ECF subfamily)